MSVIAWDGQRMASDSLCMDSSGRKAFVKKMWRLEDGSLFGAVGRLEQGLLLKEWIEGGCEEDKVPAPLPNSEDTACLWVKKGGEVWHLSNDAVPFQLTIAGERGGIDAVGAGADYALAVLEMGYSAPEAVKIAIRFNGFCGGDIQILTLNPSK